MDIGVNKNNEDIFTRAIIAGVLNLLNNKITYNQYHCDGSIDNIIVPWYYNMSGDERFMQDFFTHYDYCLNSDSPKKISGNFDIIPRGLITYMGSTIAQDSLTSRFVKGNFYKDINGKLESYTSYLFSIPLNIKFSCELIVDNFTNALRIEEIIRESLYKTQTMYVMYKGMRIGAQVGFPESITTDKNVSYSFETERNIIKMSFEIEIETYQPCFDKSTEYPSNKVVKSVGMNLYNINDNRDITKLFFTSPSKDLKTIYQEAPYLIEWNYIDENAIINKIDLCYIKDGIEYEITKSLPNHMMYIWDVPVINEHTNFNLILNTELKILKEANIKVVPSDVYIDDNSFIIINGGEISATDGTVISATIEYINKKGKIVYTKDDVMCVIKDNTINKITCKKTKLDINRSEDISIKLRAYSSTDKSIYCESNFIQII